MQPYTVTLVKVGPRFRKIGVRQSVNDAMMSLLRLFSAAVCIKHFTIYTHKVFCHLKMLWIRSWVQSYTSTLMTVAADLGKNGVRLSGNDAMMSLLRLLSTTSCSTFSHYMYIKCLSTLRCCG